MTQPSKPHRFLSFYALMGVSAGALACACATHASPTESMLWADVPEIAVQDGAVVYTQPAPSVVRTEVYAPPAPAATPAPARPAQASGTATRSYPAPYLAQQPAPAAAKTPAAPVPAPAARDSRVYAQAPAAPHATPRAASSHLASLVRAGLQRSPGITYNVENQNLMRALYDEQVAQQGPQVTGYGNLTGDYDSSSQKSSRFTNTVRLETGLRTNYTLYSFGAAQNRVAASQRNVDRAGHQLQEQKQATAFEIAGTYLEWLRQRELVDIEHYRMREHEHFLSIMETAFAAGQVQKSQIYLARTGTTQRKQALLNAQKNLQQVTNALERMVGGSLNQASADIPPAPALNITSEGAFIDRALARSSQLEAYKSALKAAELERAAVDQSRYGAVNLNVNLGTDRIVKSGHGNEFSSTAALEYAAPLYTHGGSDARMAQANARIALAQAELDSATQTLREQLQTAYFTLRSADELQSLAEQEAAEGTQILDAFKGEIMYGTRPFSDISAQIDSIAAARGRAVSARISKVLAGYAVLRFQNELVEHFN